MSGNSAVAWSGKGGEQVRCDSRSRMVCRGANSALRRRRRWWMSWRLREGGGGERDRDRDRDRGEVEGRGGER